MPSFTPTLFFWYLFPMVTLVAIGILLRKFRVDKKYGLRAPDIVTVILLVAIHFISKGTFNESFVPYVLLMIFFIGMTIAVFQTYQFQEIIYRRYFKMLWRITFLVTLLIYVLLVVISIITFLMF